MEMKAKLSTMASLNFLTEIQFQGNKNLAGVSHVIVDEVHERSLLVSYLYLRLSISLDCLE